MEETFQDLAISLVLLTRVGNGDPNHIAAVCAPVARVGHNALEASTAVGEGANVARRVPWLLAIVIVRHAVRRDWVLVQGGSARGLAVI